MTRGSNREGLLLDDWGTMIHALRTLDLAPHCR